MVLKIAVCDDDEIICEDLKKILEQIAESNACEFEISTFTSGEDFIKYFLEDENDLDVLFLDIEFPGEKEKNGVYIGNVLKNELYAETHLVYISSHETYFKELFANRPVDFIGKSPDNKFVYVKVENAIKNIIGLITKQNKVFEYKVGKNEYSIALHKILYFENRKRKVEIVTFKENLKENIFYGNISEIGEQLADSDFIFLNQSLLVNYHAVKEFEGDKVTLINGKILYMSRSRQQEVHEFCMKKARKK